MLETTLLLRRDKEDLYQINDFSYLKNIDTFYIEASIVNNELNLYFYDKNNNPFSSSKKIDEILNKILKKYDIPNKKVIIDRTELNSSSIIVKYNKEDFSNKVNQNISINLFNDIIEEFIYNDFIIKNQLVVSRNIIEKIKSSDRYIQEKKDEYQKIIEDKKDEFKELKNALNKIKKEVIFVDTEVSVDYWGEDPIDVDLNPIITFYIKNNDLEALPNWAITNINEIIQETNNFFGKKVLNKVSFQDFVNEEEFELKYVKHNYKTPIQIKTFENKLIYEVFIEKIKNSPNFLIKKENYEKNLKKRYTELIKDLKRYEDYSEDFGDWNFNFDLNNFKSSPDIDNSLIVNTNSIQKVNSKKNKITTDFIKKEIEKQFNIENKNLKRINKKKIGNETVRIFENKVNGEKFEVKSNKEDTLILNISHIDLNIDLNF